MNENQNYLSQVRIASPCTADWDKMTGDDRVRHCQQCKLNVFNISEMTENEATKLIQNKTGRLCIQMYKRKDGTVITKDCPKGLEKVRRAYRRCAVAAASMVAWLGFAAPGYAQLGGEAVLPQNNTNNSSNNQIRGRVKPIRGKVNPGYNKKQNDNAKQELGNYLPPVKGEAAVPPIMGDVCVPSKGVIDLPPTNKSTKGVLRGAPIPPPTTQTKGVQNQQKIQTKTKPNSSKATQKKTTPKPTTTRTKPQTQTAVPTPPPVNKKTTKNQTKVQKKSTKNQGQGFCGVGRKKEPIPYNGPTVEVIDNVDIKSKTPIKCGVIPLPPSKNNFTPLNKRQNSGNGLLASGLAIMLLAAVSKFVFGSMKRRSSIWIVGSSFAGAFIAIGLLWQLCW